MGRPAGSASLGPTADEVIELAHAVGRAADRKRFGGLSFMAIPNDAQALHTICFYILLYTLAGVVSGA